MTHRKGAVWTERLLLVLILASLGGTLNLVLTIHRRVNAISSARPAETVAQPEPSVDPAGAEDRQSPPGRRLRPPLRDRTRRPHRRARSKTPRRRSWRGWTRAIEREREAASEADRRAATLEAAIRNSVAESQRWKRREMLVRQQIARLNRRAEQLEQAAMTVDAERDVLARERDALKAATHQGEPAVGILRPALQGAQWHLAAADRPGVLGQRGEAPAAAARPSRCWSSRR